MKNSIKILILIFIIGSGFRTNAQTFGIRGGLNLAKIDFDINDGPDMNQYIDNLTGFHVGGTYEYSFSEFLSLETGLFLDTKGFKMSGFPDYSPEYQKMISSKNLEDYSFNATLYYFDIPVLLKGTYGLNDNLNIFAVAGPYIGFGLSGKFKSEYGNHEETEDVKWGSGDNDDLKRFDYGLTFGGGVVFKSILLGVYYDLGLADIATDSNDGSFKNKVLKFSVGYIFN